MNFNKWTTENNKYILNDCDVNNMKWEIRYYLNEQAFKCGVVAFRETINGDRNFVVNWANNRLKHSNFKFFDITQK